jgi:aminoglycoside phosphotransferase (APT) family kinase protein
MSEEWNDQPVTARKGEELDVSKLATFLAPHIGVIDSKLVIRQFPGGYSNLTYALSIGNHEWVLRRPPIGANIKSGHDMNREFSILSALENHYTKIPKPLIYSENLSIMGCPFYIMERVAGVILRPNMPTEMRPSPTLMSGIADAWLDTLIELHKVDYGAAGLGDLGRPDGYVQRQIEGWGKRYFNAKTDEVPKLEEALKWLEANQPSSSAVSLIHNDFKYDNLVLSAGDWTDVKAVLDWEMATIGDPLMDLGTSIGYWVNHDDPDFMLQMKLSPTHLPGNPKRGEIMHQYALKSGKEISNPVFLYVYGLFKIAVIAQQIYARYKQGFSKDPRFAGLIDGVRAMGEMANRAIERKKVDDLY